jgi:hypothetical protein
MITLAVYIVVGLVSTVGLLYTQGSFKKRGTRKGGVK